MASRSDSARHPGGFDKLVIEITESALVDGHGRARDTLSILSRFGVKIGIDDFNAGYSNLELLDRLEPSIVKIDWSLLERALDHRRGSILDAAVHLAHALEAEIMVEGVEDQRIWDYVKKNSTSRWLRATTSLAPLTLRETIEWLAAAGFL